MNSPENQEIIVSTPLHRRSPLEVTERAACMCDHGDVCSSFAPGHALHLIQARLASATPSDWIDGIVDHADAVTGELRVRSLDGDTRSIWNASGAALEAPEGTPVALHSRYNVLSVGRAQFNVAVG
ncbi:hypothetical protein [Microbacterium murale]|uniref:Uncharacterized protein n=1 Tax=Microbacterium murale TaxID=1081040 RepID=A0ABU0P5Z2_9MICO|nr:hypothetical protein [Microbacterium murale]MDQ0642739.1 hypothetical protein [Microbacterium murale]